MSTDLDEKFALIEKRMRHLIKINELFHFNWKQWETLIGKRGQAIRDNFAKRYPALCKAYEDHKDLGLIHYILNQHPEWKNKLPEKIEFPK